MKFKDFVQKKYKKKKKKEVDKLDYNNPGYIVYPVYVPSYPNVNQPAGGPVHGTGIVS